MAKSDSETQNDYDAAERGQSKPATERRRQTKGLRSPGRYKAASKEMMWGSWAEKAPVKGKRVKKVEIPDLPDAFALLTLSPVGLEKRKQKREIKNARAREARKAAPESFRAKENERSRKWREDNSERAKKWREENKERKREYYLAQKATPEGHARLLASAAKYREKVRNDPEKMARRREVSRATYQRMIANPVRLAARREKEKVNGLRYRLRKKARDNGTGSRSSIGLPAGPRGSSSEGEG